MKRRLINSIRNHDFAHSLLQGALAITLLFILLLLPSFEPGTELAIFLGTFAIVILSILSAHYSQERTELLREQNDLIESQMAGLAALEEMTREQTESFQVFSNNLSEIEESVDKGGGEEEGDEGKNEEDVEKATTD